MSPCDRSLLVEWADGTLPELGRSAVEVHLAGCAACGRDAGAIGQARRALRATATFPIPTHQAWFRLRYAVAARRRRRLMASAAMVAGAVAATGALAAAALRAFVA